MAGQRESGERESARDDTPHAAAGAEGSPAASMLDGLLRRGRPSPRAVAELLERYPGDHHEIFARLHQTLGNAFVQDVVAEMSSHQDSTEAQAPANAKANSATPRAGSSSRSAEPAEVDTQATTEAGFAGNSQPLPHIDRIQTSFGEHDLHGVQAHVGGDAAAAASQLGAAAYTSGERVAFASQPDLHTAAHEAAHVIQNRASPSDGALGAGGALTSPGDSRERHADAVADRVVRSESAAPLLAAPPTGTEIARKTTKVDEPADSAAAMAELKVQLDHGITNPTRIAMLASMLSWEDKVHVRDDKFAIIEKGCTAPQVLTIASALEISGLEIVKAGLRKGATARDFGPAVRGLGEDDLVSIADDPDALSQLRAALPGPVIAHLPSVRPIYPKVAANGPLMHWFIESLTSRAIWREVGTATAKKEIAATLNAEHLWGWVSQISGQGISTWEITSVREYASFADEPAKTQLEAIANAGPQPVAIQDPNDDAQRIDKDKKESDARAAARVQLEKLVAGESPIAADKLMDLVGRTASTGSALAKSAHARKRFIATLTADQLETAVDTLQFSQVERVDWLLDAPGIDSKRLLGEIAGAAMFDDTAAIFADPGRVKKLHKLIGDAASFMSFAGSAPKLQQLAFKNDQLREWMLGGGTAIDIYNFVMLGGTADSIAKACKLVAKDHGYAWVYELVNSERNTEKMRQLALALPDKSAAAHVLKYGIDDHALTKSDPIATSMPIEAGVYDQPGQQLRGAVAGDRGAEVAADAAEMSDAERASARADHKLVDKAIASAAKGGNAGFDAVRTARELDGSLADTLRAIGDEAWSVDHGGFRTYARERPAAEQIEVASDPKLAKTAEQLLHYSPFNALPGLRDSSALTNVLTANPHFLDWVTRTTSPVEAIALLGATPTVAPAAAHAFEVTSVSLIRELPSSGLTVNQKAALARIGEHATGQKLHEAVSDRLAGDPDNQHNRDHARAVNDKHLAEALDHLKATNADAKDVQAACNAHSEAEALELLSDTSHRSRIEFLRLTLQVSPLTVFPWLAARASVFINLPVTDWLLGTEEPVAVLRAVAKTPAAIATVALAIDAQERCAQHWVSSLPSGYGLSAGDEATLDAIYRKCVTDDAAKWLFMARFGHMPDGDWSRAGLDKMWASLGRLSDRQVAGNTKFGGLAKVPEDENTQIGGSYSPSDGVISIKSETGTETRYENGRWQSKPGLAAELGVDEAEIDRRLNAGLLESRIEKSKTLYRVKPVEADRFTDTVLHETGHAVDAMLGNRTDLVFGMAGWKSYSGGDFDTWATEMGAWSGATVGSADKAEIRGVFEQRLKSSGAIYGPSMSFVDFVPEDNPLRQPKNHNAAIAKGLRSSDRAYEYTHPVEHGGRMYIMNHYYGRFFSYDAKIHNIIPLPYAGFAPEEFFAECYVEYYRDENNKGGNLPSWIKTWFDANVDRIGHGPAKKAP